MFMGLSYATHVPSPDVILTDTYRALSCQTRSCGSNSCRRGDPAHGTGTVATLKSQSLSRRCEAVEVQRSRCYKTRRSVTGLVAFLSRSSFESWGRTLISPIGCVRAGAWYPSCSSLVRERLVRDQGETVGGPAGRSGPSSAGRLRCGFA